MLALSLLALSWIFLRKLNLTCRARCSKVLLSPSEELPQVEGNAKMIMSWTASPLSVIGSTNQVSLRRVTNHFLPRRLKRKNSPAVPVVSLLGIRPDKIFRATVRDARSKGFMAALFIRVQCEKQPKHPTIRKWQHSLRCWLINGLVKYSTGGILHDDQKSWFLIFQL